MRGIRGLVSFATSMALFITLLGGILLGVAYITARSAKESNDEKRICTETENATVVHLNIFERKESDEIDALVKRIYSAKYSFNANGEEYFGYYESEKPIEMGDEFEIKYNPNDPNTSLKKTEAEKMPPEEFHKQFFFYPGAVLAGFGIIAFVGFIILGAVVRKKDEARVREELRLADERYFREKALREQQQKETKE